MRLRYTHKRAPTHYVPICTFRFISLIIWLHSRYLRHTAEPTQDLLDTNKQLKSCVLDNFRRNGCEVRAMPPPPPPIPIPFGIDTHLHSFRNLPLLLIFSIAISFGPRALPLYPQQIACRFITAQIYPPLQINKNSNLFREWLTHSRSENQHEGGKKKIGRFITGPRRKASMQSERGCHFNLR